MDHGGGRALTGAWRSACTLDDARRVWGRRTRWWWAAASGVARGISRGRRARLRLRLDDAANARTELPDCRLAAASPRSSHGAWGPRPAEAMTPGRSHVALARSPANMAALRSRGAAGPGAGGGEAAQARDDLQLSPRRRLRCRPPLRLAGCSPSPRSSPTARAWPPANRRGRSGPAVARAQATLRPANTCTAFPFQMVPV